MDLQWVAGTTQRTVPATDAVLPLDKVIVAGKYRAQQLEASIL